MAITMYSASVPVMARMLANMATWLDKAAAHAADRKFDAGLLLAQRLAPDMLPLAKQIQIASDNAKGPIARLAGVEIPKFEDTETTLDDMLARIRKTIDFIQSVPEAKFEGSESREIVMALRSGEIRFTGEDYLRFFAMPNFMFHVTTAYALLREAGVQLGKMDYLNGVKSV